VTGQITELHLKHTRWGAAGGLIRCSPDSLRVPFDAAELAGKLPLRDALGVQVNFDLLNGVALRVRPVPGARQAVA
jgi:hypothetical protein